jgi:hypothetical protein
MVANNFLGLLSKPSTRSPAGLCSLDRRSKSVLDSEKKAISVPEIIAEQNKRKTSAIDSVKTTQLKKVGKSIRIGSMSTILKYYFKD